MTVRPREDHLTAETPEVQWVPDEIGPPSLFYMAFQVRMRLRTPDGTDGPLTMANLHSILVYTTLVIY
jgi:hypothetical protein